MTQETRERQASLRDVAISRALDLVSQIDSVSRKADVYMILIRAGQTGLIPQARPFIDKSTFRYEYDLELEQIQGSPVKSPAEEALESGDNEKVLQEFGGRSYPIERTKARLALGQTNRAVYDSIHQFEVEKTFPVMLEAHVNNLDVLMQALQDTRNKYDHDPSFYVSRQYARAYLELAKTGREDALELAWEVMYGTLGHPLVRDNPLEDSGIKDEVEDHNDRLSFLTDFISLGKKEAIPYAFQDLEQMELLLDHFYDKTGMKEMLRAYDKGEPVRNPEVWYDYIKMREEQTLALAKIARVTGQDIWRYVFAAANHVYPRSIGNDFFDLYSSLLSDGDLSRIYTAARALERMYDPFQKAQAIVAIDQKEIELRGLPYFMPKDAKWDYKVHATDEAIKMAEHEMNKSHRIVLYSLFARAYKDSDMLNRAMDISKSEQNLRFHDKYQFEGQFLLDAALELGDLDAAMKIVESFRGSSSNESNYSKALGYAYIAERTK